ncbi:MAG: hypothetical protein Q4F97_07665 [Bacteroidales bacterium]|nr:hypothetical protein [Bacteroidales bacterium]
MSLSKSDSIVKLLSKQENLILLPNELKRNIPLSTQEKILEHNKNLYKIKNEIYKPFYPKRKAYNISKKLAEEINIKTAFLIRNFKAIGTLTAILDGETYTFRCIEEDELLTLKVSMPKDKPLLLADILCKMMNDVRNNQFNENKYLQMLDEIN